MNTRVVYSSIFFTLVMLIIFIMKPTWAFKKEDGKYVFKPFGLGKTNTLLAFGIVTVIVAVLSHAVFTLLDLSDRKSNINSNYTHMQYRYPYLQ